MPARRNSDLQPIVRFVAAVLCGFALAPAAFAQIGASVSSRAEAEVVIPIRAVPLSDLSFGSIAVRSAGEGSVEIAADGSPPRYVNTARSSCSGQPDCMPYRASFDVSGDPGRRYRVSMPARIVAYGVRTGAGLPVVSLEAHSLNAPSAAGEGRLDNAGRDRFFVGGTLQVPAGTVPDVFRAELPVIVAYN